MSHKWHCWKRPLKQRNNVKNEYQPKQEKNRTHRILEETKERSKPHK